MARSTKTQADDSTDTVDTTETPTEEYYTGYKASNVLAEQGISVRPQMLYAYIRDNRIKTNADNKIAASTLKAWAEEYVAKKADREAKRQAKLEADTNQDTDTNTEVTEAE